MATIRRAVILAAGRGERLLPLTADRPKPMVAVGGRPILERVLHGLRWAGVEEAVIVHGYLGQVIEDYFGDGSAFGLRLQYRAQRALTGTATAMTLTEDFCGDEPFLLHWGDILVDPANYPAIFSAYNTTPSPVCKLGMLYVEDPCAGGAVYLDNARVVRVVEKPAPGTAATHWQIGGVIVFSPIVWHYLHATPPPAQGEFYVTQVIQAMIDDGQTVQAFTLRGRRIHITSPANVEALHGDPRIHDWEKLCSPCSPLIAPA